MTLLGTQTGRPFPGRQESGGTGQAGNTRPMTDSECKPCTQRFSARVCQIYITACHHSKKKMLLSFYALKNIS